MDWINIPDDIDIYFSFVYKITRLNALPGEKRYYIGYKQTKKKLKRKPLKGKTKKRICYVESDWKDYWGSCNELLEDIKVHGKENFQREILHLCNSKWEGKYLEAKEQFKHNVLVDEESYNGIINIRLGKLPKNTSKTKEELMLP